MSLQIYDTETGVTIDLDEPILPPDDWVLEAREILRELQGRHSEARRITILELVRARLEGRGVSSVFELPGTVPIEQYYGRDRSDPIFQQVYQKVLDLAITSRESASASNLQKAVFALSVNTTLAVQTILRVMISGDDRTRLQAAIAVLDRAGLGTAQKGTLEIKPSWREQATAMGLDPKKLFDALVNQLSPQLPGPGEFDDDEPRNP